MLYLSNLIHPIQTGESYLAAIACQWMLRNYWRHLTPDGCIDVESLAEQAALECDIDRSPADDLAALVATEVDG